ncbi:hypothetical protein DL98DRAFT_643966, partial [Cadophora sp. DSE1049]
RVLVDVMKVYLYDNKKYEGELYDILNIKLQIFYDCCVKVGLEEEQYYQAFSVMFKGRASDFYYDKIAGRSYNFGIIVVMTKAYFETEENRMLYFFE